MCLMLRIEVLTGSLEISYRRGWVVSLLTCPQIHPTTITDSSSMMSWLVASINFACAIWPMQLVALHLEWWVGSNRWVQLVAASLKSSSHITNPIPPHYQWHYNWNSPWDKLKMGLPGYERPIGRWWARGSPKYLKFLRSPLTIKCEQSWPLES